MPANTDFLGNGMDREKVNRSRSTPPAGRIIKVDGDDDSGSMQAMIEGQQRLEKQTQELMARMTAQQNLMASQQKLEKQIEMLSKSLAEPACPPPPERPKARNKQPMQEPVPRQQPDKDGRGRQYDDNYDDEEYRDYDHKQSRAKEARGKVYDDGYDVEDSRRDGHRQGRARDMKSRDYDDGYDAEDGHYRGHKSNRAKERGPSYEDRYDAEENRRPRRKQQEYNDYNDGAEDWDDGDHRGHGNGKQRGDDRRHGGDHHDDHDRHEHRQRTSIQRRAIRHISWVRGENMKHLHGDSALHIAAWIAEVITCFLFTVACLIMLALWIRHVNEEAFVNTFFVTAIAAMTYFAKACHMGDMMFKGHVVPIARYIDWITTTPLMLYEVCHIAHATASMTIMVIVCDLLMLATGIIGALIPWKPLKGLKMVWFMMSCLFYILMLVVLQTDVAYKASYQIEVAQNLFKQLKYLTVIVWTFYPIVVAMGRAHLGLITKSTEDIMLCVMDVIAKIGMEGLIVGSCFNGCLGDGGGH